MDWFNEVQISNIKCIKANHTTRIIIVVLSKHCYCVFVWFLQIINTFTEAVQTVDIDQAIGKPHSLWVAFAKFYEDNGQLPEVINNSLATVVSSIILPLVISPTSLSCQRLVLFSIKQLKSIINMWMM